ncbi:Glycoside hydrolase, family 9 [Artemisia annua]|uniref:cellulase n=1 Tax=Artemisia annua TaxID=35608 RepID=A0A2U1N6E5_ARTAN|nr:Glycoside hydrolase, family 9 [Artemisia annua]
MSEKRPLKNVTTSKQGSYVVAETAAAMASVSLVFKSSNSEYSKLRLKHAEELFNFANEHRGTYSKSIPEVEAYYKPTGYGDELLWAASWLYHATRDNMYLDFITGDGGEDFENRGNSSWFSWDDKLPGTRVLLSGVSFLGLEDSSDMENINEYRKTVEVILCNILPRSPLATSSRTKESFSPSDIREFAKSQVWGASIPANATTGCKDGMKWQISSKPNPNVATGALVGGPHENDKYIDSRKNSMQGETSTYNSVVLVGLLSGLVSTSFVPKSFT